MVANLGAPTQQGNGGDSLPAVKWLKVGEEFIGRVVDASWDVPVTDIETGQPALNQRGNVKTQHVVTLQVMAGTTASVGTEKRPAEVGELVTLWVAGADKYSSDNPQCFSEALDGHGGTLGVGDVVKVVFASTKPSKWPQPLKVKTFQMRKPKPDETEAVAKAQAAYDERQAAKATALGGPESVDDF